MSFFERLFDEPGKKIKKLAFVSFVIDAVASIITGIGFIANSSDIDDGFFILGICLIIFCVPIAWILNILLYGFGELIENSYYSRINSSKLNHTLSQTYTHEQQTKENKKQPKSSSNISTSVADLSSNPNIITTKEKEKTDTTNFVPSRDASIKAKLEYALQYSTIAGTRSFLNMYKDPQILKILEFSDDQIISAIINALDTIEKSNETPLQ